MKKTIRITSTFSGYGADEGTEIELSIGEEVTVIGIIDNFIICSIQNREYIKFKAPSSSFLLAIN